MTERQVQNPPFDLPAAHIFKISGGKIHQIEAMGFLAPYNSPSGGRRAHARECHSDGRIGRCGGEPGGRANVCCAWAHCPYHYRNFNSAVYVRAYEVDRMKDAQWLQQSWDVISHAVKINKVYLETHRDKLLVDAETIEKAKAFFAARGVQTFGGITWTRNESNRFETFCYANAQDRAWVKHVAEETARHFV
ncbi:MAG: hypothetical protein WDM77_14915 [Steroidobacteraceae bacterium]